MIELYSILLIPVILMVLANTFKILIINAKFKKSQYGQASGSTLWNIVFNKGNYGQFITFN